MTALATLDDLKRNGIEVTGRADGIKSARLGLRSRPRRPPGVRSPLGEWTVDLPGEQSRKLDLPCRAVRDVSKVLVEGQSDR